MILSLLMVAIAHAQVDEEDCGRSCLNDCRDIAIHCVRGGIRPSEFEKLMSCVFSNSFNEKFQEGGEESVGVICQGCINEQLETLTFQQKAECLNRDGVKTCDNIRKQSDCDQLFQTEGCEWKDGKCASKSDCSGYDNADECRENKCGWIGQNCYLVKPNDLKYDQYKEVIAQIPEDECRHHGGKFRNGKCQAKAVGKVKCGNVNRGRKKITREVEKKKELRLGECKTCKDLCDWLPRCEYKPRVNRCKGEIDRPFVEL